MRQIHDKMIKIRSVYDIEVFKAFQKYNSRKVFVLAYLTALTLFAVGILLAFLKKDVFVAYILCGVLLPLFMHTFYKVIEVENLNKNIYLKSSTIQIFTFDEEDIELEQVCKNNTFKEKYSYRDIIKVVKYKKYYFLYINRAQALVIKNADYVYGNENELDEMFKKQKGNDFIKRRVSRKKENIETND